MGTHRSLPTRRPRAARTRNAVLDHEVAEARVILDAVRRLVRVLRVPSRDIERTLGITSAQLFVLEQLRASSASSVNALAARTRTHQSTVSVVVTKLCELGLVVRTPAAEDARRVELSLSARGRAVVDRAPPTPQSRLVAGLALLPAAERAALAGGLSSWVAAVGADHLTPSLFFEDGSEDAAQRTAPAPPKETKGAPRAR